MPEAQPHRFREEHAWGGTGYGDVRGHIKLDVPYPWGSTATSLSSSTSSTLMALALTGRDRIDPSDGENTEAEWRQLWTQRIGDPAYEPARTPLGAKLRRWRAQYIESGGRLLTWEEIEREVAERRGGVESGA